MRKLIIKSGGHCYNGVGLQICEFWAVHNTKIGKNPEGVSRCLLFGGSEGIVKDASKSLNICDKMYGKLYEGEA